MGDLSPLVKGDPRWDRYLGLAWRPAGLSRPARRRGERPLLPLVGDERSLLEKEGRPWVAVGQRWAREEVAPGVPRCPATFGDHQWPSHRQSVRLRFSVEVVR